MKTGHGLNDDAPMQESIPSLPRMTRRSLLAIAVATILSGCTKPAAIEALDLDWHDLLPPGAVDPGQVLRGRIEHADASRAQQLVQSAGVRADLDGKTVRLPGFVVPLDYDGTGLSSFLLVPFVGACVHVPPPPPNQIVYVTSEEPVESRRLFDAVVVTGVIQSARESTELAESGYRLAAIQVATHEP